MAKLTKTLIDSTKAPESGELWLWDSELKGFGVRIQASGSKTYVVRYRTKDAERKQRKIVVCRCSDAPPEKARNLARDIFMAVAAGGDPAKDRKPEEKKVTVTLEQMFKARIAAMRARGRANAIHNERALLLSKHNAADFMGRDRHPSEITPDDVIRFVSKHYKEGKRGAADKARGYLAAAFEWAIKSANDYTVEHRQDWGIVSNPAAAVAKDPNAIGVRDRNLSASEIGILWKACGSHDSGLTLEVATCVRVIIACGQRVEETLRLEGSELDMEKCVWNMPAHKTKGGKHDHQIPLPAIIIDDLKALKAKHGDGFLFPARTGAACPTIVPNSILQGIKRWRDKSGADIEAFQTRDLRRTWKSRTHDAGIDRFTRDLIQQHAKSDTGSKNYDRADYYDIKRSAMDRWSVWLGAVVTDEDPKAALAESYSGSVKLAA